MPYPGLYLELPLGLLEWHIFHNRSFHPIHAIGIGEGINDLRPFDARETATVTGSRSSRT